MSAPVLSRRAILAGIGGAVLAAGCSRGAGERGVLRIGVMANLTHAPMLAGIRSGRIAKALGATRIEVKVFRAGPRVTEALLGGAIDVGSAGPAAVVMTHARHPSAFRIALGICSGGASFVLAKSLGAASPGELRGKTFATPQIGSTQDVALRKYLHGHGLELAERGGDVHLTALASSDIRAQLARGQLHGAWLPEPWGTRVVGEGITTRFLDERTLWPGGRFPTALLVARSELARERKDELACLVAAVRAEVERALGDPASTEEDAYAEVKELVTNAGPRPLFHDAWSYVDFTTDPLPAGIERFAADAYDLGLVPKVACGPLFGGERA